MAGSRADGLTASQYAAPMPQRRAWIVGHPKREQVSSLRIVRGPTLLRQSTEPRDQSEGIDMTLVDATDRGDFPGQGGQARRTA